MQKCFPAGEGARLCGASSYTGPTACGGMVKRLPKPAMLTPKVVLVEDNTTIRETLVPALQELAGASVVAMADGAQEALETLRQVPWDVLVLDMFLREGTGLEVLAQLPGELAGRKVYVLTNYATADLREACVRLGADAVFDKSTELDEFFAAFLA